jgi:hypothetical protein
MFFYDPVVLRGGPRLTDGFVVRPKENRTVDLTLSPEPGPDCSDNPAMDLRFRRAEPDPPETVFDVMFNPEQQLLHTGTVAGELLLRAHVNGADLVPIEGPASVTLNVPSDRGVIESVAINLLGESSIQIIVAGYSTPRETGDSATTELCLEFFPAAGARVRPGSQFCVLREDLRIWYERAASHPYGSQFSCKLTASLVGDKSAIGGVKVVLRNKHGESEPYCVDIRSGNGRTCPE